ncbi:Galactose-binding protein regulator [Kytococcus sedentarius]|nr:LysR family transcriptional regulator [Kytococcus aerolatus]ACV05210.1 transcriptional regulator [Kytococcus sedentarius DSM 20547]STX13383.1 Galactose-binding protein regulator [Kytococcus sedentarius]
MLVESVSRHGSVGAAARELLTTQPSASRRLAALERRLGVTLFERDTTGARATPAGRELARQAARLLSELEAVPARIAAAVEAPSVSLGTIQALAPMVFTAAQIELEGIRVQAEVDHGPVLISEVAQGVLDAAIVTIADQSVLPRGVRVTELGVSPLVLVLPAGAGPLPRGRRGLKAREVVYSSIDLGAERLHAALSEAGARPCPGLTLEATLRVARHRGIPAVVPEFAARWWGAATDQVLPSPVAGTIRLSLVARSPGPPSLLAAHPALAARVLGVPERPADDE